MKLRLLIIAGEFRQAVKEGEILRRSVSYLNRKDRTVYLEILHELLRAYLESGLSAGVGEIIAEIHHLDPGSARSAWWKLVFARSTRPYRMTGLEPPGEPDRQLVLDTHTIPLRSSEQREVVYLLERPTIRILLPDAQTGAFRDQTLIRMFLDGRIYREFYLEPEDGGEREIQLPDSWEIFEVMIDVQ